MKNTQNKSGFTLVELIIVITILAVLATIAFISFQGYAAEARDSKVQSEIGQLRSSIEALSAAGTPLLSMVADTGSNLSNITIGGTGADINTSNYKAGDINFTVLGADSNKFGDYKLGVSQKGESSYELAGTLEKTNTAFVTGKYNPRLATPLSGTGTSTSQTIILTSTGAGLMKVGDITTLGKVVKVGTDLVTVTVDGTVSDGVTTITLFEAESEGLIASYNSNTGAVVHKGAALPYE